MLCKHWSEGAKAVRTDWTFGAPVVDPSGFSGFSMLQDLATVIIRMKYCKTHGFCTIPGSARLN